MGQSRTVILRGYILFWQRGRSGFLCDVHADEWNIVVTNLRKPIQFMKYYHVRINDYKGLKNMYVITSYI